MIAIKPPLCFSEKGHRENNEDFILPARYALSTGLFIVCDGMGGLDKGELAAKTVATQVYGFILNADKGVNVEHTVNGAVAEAYETLEKELENDQYIARMGSTLALVYFREKEVVLAHIGDSRIYHVRNGKIHYKTRDHKQVEDMVDNNIITAEQAVWHPWRNRLSKSVSVAKGGFIRHESTVKVITDILSGDYFFICTDGVLEQLSDDLLCRILEETFVDNSFKLQKILDVCEGKSQDNYSGYLLQVV